jgi:ribosomal protein L14
VVGDARTLTLRRCSPRDMKKKGDITDRLIVWKDKRIRGGVETTYKIRKI